jgi:DNA-binding response OmpR family regulator
LSTDTVLLVEDNPRIRTHVERILRTAGYVVRSCETPEEFLQESSGRRYALYIVDLRLGDCDGRDLIDDVRRAGDETPVLILSADSQVDTKVSGLTAGADDYLTKPFHPRELVSRVAALLRRAARHAAPALLYAGLELDEASNEAGYQGRRTRLTRTEARALELLIRAGGRTVRRETLQVRLGGSEAMSDYAVDKTISRLRKALEGLGSPIAIRTAKGLGYSLDEAVEA